VIAVRMGNFKEVGGLQFEDNTKYLSEGDYKDKYLLNLLHSKKGEAKEN
jgi:hypothetical protein